jgi:AcrR family transcriptional regulator
VNRNGDLFRTPEKPVDRRVQRTRRLLQQALIELLNERSYDDVTVQDIVDRANVGRTTFYTHFNSKEELFITCHEAVTADFRFWPLSAEAMLSPEPPPEMVAAYRHMEAVRPLMYPIFHGKDGALVQRRMRDWSAQVIEESLRAAFAETDSAIPFAFLANYLAGAQIALIQWWMEKHTAYSADDLAAMFHRLQRAALRDALGKRD